MSGEATRATAGGLVVFAHVPPPEHGQSRMVAALLASLAESGLPPVIHVDARVSGDLNEVGGLSPAKLWRLAACLGRALSARFRHGCRLLYYIPGPVKWSAVLRDWLAMCVLRPAFPGLIFHWHAIGQGEWAHGSRRCRLPGPRWLDLAARRASAFLLEKPCLSLVVSPASDTDARAVGSGRIEVVCNGLDDPCPDYGSRVAELRVARRARLAAGGGLPLRVLFLAHGTEEKGLFDAVEAVDRWWQSGAVADLPGLRVTFAGGVAAGLEHRFGATLADLLGRHGKRGIEVLRTGYVRGPEKARLFEECDVFLAPSRWESFGLTVVEAMAWGVPVVAAASDGARGVLPAGYPYLAPPGDPAGLARVLGACGADLLGGGHDPWGPRLRLHYEERFSLARFRLGIRAALAAAMESANAGRVAP